MTDEKRPHLTLESSAPQRATEWTPAPDERMRDLLADSDGSWMKGKKPETEMERLVSEIQGRVDVIDAWLPHLGADIRGPSWIKTLSEVRDSLGVVIGALQKK